MKKSLFALLLFALAAFACDRSAADDIVDRDPAAAAKLEAKLVSDVRQVTFGGRRAGEGYFSTDGTRMVFQSERDPSNPFYQIYLMNLETGDLQRISPGHGKTTCAWIHPDGDRILYASTHHDEESRRLQQAELDFRESGAKRRYEWDYDPEFELYEHILATGENRRLTEARGYDAEGSYSPDGKTILFASNRAAYERELSEREAALFEHSPASMIDIYKMDADGSNVVRLTENLGYDGGPFFSPDGGEFCWRRFNQDGTTAEVYTMSIDGGEPRRLTNIGAMSWAPYYHPSGRYLVFTTNLHGFANFELYLVRSDGQGDPVRVTYTDGFDGLPVFTPDGKQLSWTTTRTDSGRSQIFMGRWDHAEALRQLGLEPDETAEQLPESDDRKEHVADRRAGAEAAQAADPEFTAANLGRHVDYLTRPELGGRLTGTEGERRATAYVAAYLESLGLEPAGPDGSWFQEFEFPAGAELGEGNRLAVSHSSAEAGGCDGDEETLQLDSQWRPLSFSGDGEFEPAGVVFAGYGIVAPGSDTVDEYDSYADLDVADKWVLAFRDLPQEIAPEVRQHLARYSAPRRKASAARDLGAKGLILVTGPTSSLKSQLIRFDRGASAAGISMAVVSIDDASAEAMFAGTGKSLAEAQQALDSGQHAVGYELPGVSVSAEIAITRRTGTGRNVLGRLRTATRSSDNTTDESSSTEPPLVIVGAHIDHLGTGAGASSLARDDERDQIHVGADDNASGVAVMLEIARHLTKEHAAGRIDTSRDLLIAAWSGEELGLFGSQAFVKSFYELFPNAPRTPSPFGDLSDPRIRAIVAAHGMSPDDEPLTAAITAYLNLDMVGRLRDALIIQGVGSSPVWRDEVQRRNVPVGLELRLDATSTRLPTDASSFVTREVPILSGFTGAHEDYHTPRDTPDKINYEGATKIAHLFSLITRGVLTADEPPPFELSEDAKSDEVPRANLAAYLGTIPDYAAGEVKGLRLSGVTADAPAAKAGLRGGDVVIELAGRKVEDINDYTYAIEALKIGEPVKVVVVRDGEEVELEVTPGSRE